MVEDDPEAVDQEDDPTTDTTADAEIDEPDAEEDEVEDDEVEDEPAVARAAAVGVLAYCERNNLPMASARSYISRGLTVAQINAERGGKDKKVRINPHGPSARITRDEVETRRTGIEGAIVARLSRDRMVNGPARDYMALSLPEMAAMSAGQRGRVQRGAVNCAPLRWRSGRTRSATSRRSLKTR
ncbi:hypothetical protein [Roseicitreum antarcticum]|uniref:hypothetical protein n=1 Tax=Roseicitreum antarcticum TaxID=564137 RepID=UPI001680A220|nr:hypothetical protein [Roseicitreum antarcticum]